MFRTITDFMIVGAGSCIGGMARYGVGLLFRSLQGQFPWSTFVVNTLGCFFIGLICGLIDKGFGFSSSMRLFVTVGFCGGFTTFSTFMRENFGLLTDSSVTTLVIYGAGSLVAGFAALYIAYWMAMRMI